MSRIPAGSWMRSIQPQQWRTLAAAMLGWLLDAMDVMMYAFALTAIRAEFSLSAATAGPRVEIGATLVVPTPYASVVGVVSAVSVPIPDLVTDQSNVHLVELNLAGEIVVDGRTGRPVFRRGVSSLPLATFRQWSAGSS